MRGFKGSIIGQGGVAITGMQQRDSLETDIFRVSGEVNKTCQKREQFQEGWSKGPATATLKGSGLSSGYLKVRREGEAEKEKVTEKKRNDPLNNRLFQAHA